MRLEILQGGRKLAFASRVGNAGFLTESDRLECLAASRWQRGEGRLIDGEVEFRLTDDAGRMLESSLMEIRGELVRRVV